MCISLIMFHRYPLPYTMEKIPLRKPISIIYDRFLSFAYIDFLLL